MDPEPQTLVKGAGLWLQWADTHGLRYDAGGKASDEITMDHCEPRDVYRVLRAPDRSGTTSAAHEAAANRAFARALLIGTGRRGGEIDFDVDPVRVIDPEERIVPRHPMPGAGGESESIATPEEGRRYSCLPDRGPAMSQPELPLPDVPLIVDDLLVQAKRLAEAGAPTEMIEEILEYVVALREGRG